MVTTAKDNDSRLQLFTMREGNIVGRREFFWEDLPEDAFDPAEFLSDVLSQYYASDYVPREIYVPVDFTIASCSRKHSRNEKAGA